jgi:hypothetical protein
MGGRPPDQANPASWHILYRVPPRRVRPASVGGLWVWRHGYARYAICGNASIVVSMMI